MAGEDCPSRSRRPPWHTANGEHHGLPVCSVEVVGIDSVLRSSQPLRYTSHADAPLLIGREVADEGGIWVRCVTQPYEYEHPVVSTVGSHITIMTLLDGSSRFQS